MFDKTKEEIKEVENKLKGYRDLIEDIELTEIRIEEIEEEYKGCSAIGYSETSGVTNKFNSTVENEILNKEKVLAELKLRLKNLKREKARIDRAVSKLDGTDKAIIELRYINKRPIEWKEIGSNIGYCSNHIQKRLKPRAIEKMIKFILY